MDVDLALLHIDADVGRRIRRRANTKRKRSDAKTEVNTAANHFTVFVRPLGITDIHDISVKICSETRE